MVDPHARPVTSRGPTLLFAVTGGNPGQGVLTCQAEPGSRSHDARELLVSRAATTHTHTHPAAVSALDEETR